jgi:ATP-dependent Clp protease ATP-binding subunit ClpC
MTRIMPQQFTDAALKSLDSAWELVRSRDGRLVDSGHLLLGLLAEGEGKAARTLGSLGVTLAAARQEIENLVGTHHDAPAPRISFTPRANHVLERAEQDSRARGEQQVGTEHLLSGLLDEDDGLALQTLTRLGIDLDRARQQVAQLLEPPHPPG